MTDQTAIFVALIAAAAGIIGALVGSWIAARETKRAGAMAHVEAQADRDEARRARFADRVSSLAGRFDGVGLGALADVTPATRFGFSSTPRKPSVTTVVTTVEAV